ncbi:MAG: glycosyltransferase, partial [Desulfobacteraceae bacterium]|nr:glycosyltransferase [Desulfobacteraceae bacterium]
RNIYKRQLHVNPDDLRIGVLGIINQAKGAELIKKLVKYIDETGQNAKVILIGLINIPINSPHFEQTGRYDKTELEKIVLEKEIDIFFIPSIWPETFSYTAEEIMRMGYPLAVFNLGAPAERVKKYNRGMVLDLDSSMEELFENLKAFGQAAG